MVQMIGSKKATTGLKKITGRMFDNLCREAASFNNRLQRTAFRRR